MVFNNGNCRALQHSTAAVSYCCGHKENVMLECIYFYKFIKLIKKKISQFLRKRTVLSFKVMFAIFFKFYMK